MPNVDEANDDYAKYLKKVKAVYRERLDQKNRQERLIEFKDRLDKSDLTPEMIIKHNPGKYMMQWRGLCLIKSPLDLSIYQLMLQEIKPPTIIEIGAFNGGGAVWMADIMKIHGHKTHVFSMDIDFSYLEVGLKDREDITFIHGDSFKISETFPEDMLKDLPHPWLLIEDAHVNITNVLEYFDKFTQGGDYIVVEDTHPDIQTRLGFGLLKDLGEYEAIGTTWAMDPFKEFIKKHGKKYRVDPAYSDLNGYNASGNSIMCKV